MDEPDYIKIPICKYFEDRMLAQKELMDEKHNALHSEYNKSEMIHKLEMELLEQKLILNEQNHQTRLRLLEIGLGLITMGLIFAGLRTIGWTL